MRDYRCDRSPIRLPSTARSGEGRGIEEAVPRRERRRAGPVSLRSMRCKNVKQNTVNRLSNRLSTHRNRNVWLVIYWAKDDCS